MTRAEFEVAAEQLRPYLIKHAQSRYIDKDAAEDIVQNTLLELFRASSSFDIRGPASVKTWMTARLDSRCTDYFRHRKTDPSGPFEPHYDPADAHSSEIMPYISQASGPGERLLGIRLDIMAAVRELPDDEREVIFRLMYGDDYEYNVTQEVMAQRLGISRSQLIRLQKRALKKLADRLSYILCGEQRKAV